MITHVALHPDIILRIQSYSFSHATRITQARLVFITPLGNAETINMIGMKSRDVYLIAPKGVTRVGADTAFGLY